MSELAVLQSRLRTIRRSLDERRGEARRTLTDGKRITSEIAELKSDIETYEQAADILTKLAEERQNGAHKQIEALVTQGLRTVFDEDISFHVSHGIRGKTPITEFTVRSKYNDRIIETSVMEAQGGGLSAIVGFLLRLVILLLSLDRNESILFLDEPFAEVSEEAGIRLASFLREIVDKTHIQIVIVCHTHKEEMLELADRKYKVNKDSLGNSKVTEL